MEKTIGSKTSKLLAVGAGAACACLLATAVAAPQPADAASVVNKHLEGGKTYTAYDVTGDGVADTVKAEFANPSYDEDGDEYFEGLAITVNGETLHTWKAAEDGSYLNTSEVMKLMVTSDGNVYFLFYDQTRYSNTLYQFTDGALKKVSVKNKVLNTCFHRDVTDDYYSVKATGKNLRLSYGVYTPAISYIYFDMDYKVKNQELMQVGTKSVGRWKPNSLVAQAQTLNFPTQVYKDIKCTKKASKLAKGSKIKTGYLVTKGSTAALQVKTSSGATRYLKVPKVWKKSQKMFAEDPGTGDEY